MNLQDLLYDEVSLLSDELRDIDNKISDAARLGKAETVTKLRQRQAQLPDLIHQAKLRDISDRINQQRTRLGVFQCDFEKARAEFIELATAFPERARELNLAKQQLTDDVNQAQLDRDNLQFAVGLEETEFERLKKQRENLLLSQSV